MTRRTENAQQQPPPQSRLQVRMDVEDVTPSGLPTETETLNPLNRTARLPEAPREIQDERPSAPQHRQADELNEVRPMGNDGSRASGNIPGNGGIPSKEKLFAMMLYRLQEEEKTYAAGKAQTEAKVLEAEQFKERHESLLTDFNVLKKQEEARAAELLEQKQGLQSISEKFKRVYDYMTGLSKDHNSLKSKAVELTRSAQAIGHERGALREQLKDAMQSLQTSEASRKATIATAKGIVKSFEEKINQQQHDITCQEELLEAERHRNEGLRAELSKLTEAHRELLRTLEGNMLALSEKFKNVPSAGTLKALFETTLDQSATNNMIEQLTSLVESINARKPLESSDLQFLENFIESHNQR